MEMANWQLFVAVGIPLATNILIFLLLRGSITDLQISVTKRIDDLQVQFAALHKRIDDLQVSMAAQFAAVHKRIDDLQVLLNKRLDDLGKRFDDVIRERAR